MKPIQIPEPFNSAHKFSSYHHEVVLASENCYCFCCCGSFTPSDINEWIDGGQTAMCPLCGIDSVIGDKSMKITKEFLETMRSYWFSEIPNDEDE